MSRLRFALFLVFALALSGMSAAKDHDRGKGRDRDEHHDRDKDRDRHQDDRRVRIHHDDRDDHRRHEIREHRDSRPPGWSHGKKTGWGDCDVPPGQAKKTGCNPGVSRDHHRHVSHRDRHQRIVRHDRDRHRHPGTVPVRTTPAQGTPSTAPIATNPGTRMPAQRPGEDDHRVPVKEVRQ